MTAILSAGRGSRRAGRAALPASPGTRRSRSSLSSSRRGPSVQERTRPTFCVVTSPASSSIRTCFLMPVSVIPKAAARSLIEQIAPSRGVPGCPGASGRTAPRMRSRAGENTEPYGSVFSRHADHKHWLGQTTQASRRTTTWRSSRSRPANSRAASRMPSATSWAERPRKPATVSSKCRSPNNSPSRRASVTPSV